MLKFYTAPGAVALASHIALIEAGADFETITLDFSKNAQREPAYLALNPKGRVPALITEHGILTENPAILVYIAQRFPEAKLAPLDNAFAFAELNGFLAYLCSTFHVATAHFARGTRWASEASSLEDMKRKVPQNARDCLKLIETEFMRGKWVFGAQYSLADPYLFRIVSWMPRFDVDLADFPKIAAHYAAMRQRPAVIRAIAQAGETI